MKFNNFNTVQKVTKVRRRLLGSLFKLNFMKWNFSNRWVKEVRLFVMKWNFILTATSYNNVFKVFINTKFNHLFLGRLSRYGGVSKFHLWQEIFSYVYISNLVVWIHVQCAGFNLIVNKLFMMGFVGSRCFAYGKAYRFVSIDELINNTQDGFLYATMRTKYTEPVDEQKVIYTASFYHEESTLFCPVFGSLSYSLALIDSQGI